MKSFGISKDKPVAHDRLIYLQEKLDPFVRTSQTESGYQNIAKLYHLSFSTQTYNCTSAFCKFDP
jgi:hypothetical protein